MNLLGHERLLLARFYCDQAIAIMDKQKLKGGEDMDSALFGVNQALKRAADFADYDK